MSKKQRILFCTYSSIYSSYVLEALLQANHVDVIGIVNSTRLLKPSFNGFTGSLKFIQLTGWRYSTYLFFMTDLFTLLQPVSQLKTVHTLAKKYNIPLLDTVDINRDKGIEFVRTLAPDVLLSAHFNQLFKAHILQLPRLAAINIHPSLLPAYKGVDPVFYGLLQQEEKLGVTAHLMDSTFDTGKILQQYSLPADPRFSVFSHNMQLFLHGTNIALEAIHSLSDKKLSVDALQQQGIGNYDSWPNKYLVRQLRRQGSTLISLRSYFKALRQTQ